jgi:hypothetical protein
MADGASKAVIEEAAGAAAGPGADWEQIFAILRDEVRKFQARSRYHR